MLRHFAVLTIAITACIGVFASGENRELVEQQAQARAPGAPPGQAKPSPAAPKVVGGLTIAPGVKFGAAAGGGDYDDSGSGGDSGGGGGGGDGSSDSLAGGPDISGSAPSVVGQPMLPPPGAPPGMRQGNQGPPLGAIPNQRGGPPKAAPPRKPTGEEIAKMLAASRERSGSQTPD